jgi:hypothetical protein
VARRTVGFRHVGGAIKDNFDRGSSTDPDRTGSRASCPLPCAATLGVVLLSFETSFPAPAIRS